MQACKPSTPRILPWCHKEKKTRRPSLSTLWHLHFCIEGRECTVMTLCLFLRASAASHSLALLFSLLVKIWLSEAKQQQQQRWKKTRMLLCTTLCKSALCANAFLPRYHPCRMTHLTERASLHQTSSKMSFQRTKGSGNLRSCVFIWKGVQGVHEGVPVCCRYDGMNKRHLSIYTLFFLDSSAPPTKIRLS